MSDEDQDRWDRKHSQDGDSEEPATFLQEIMDGKDWNLPPGTALDIACGNGRNAIFLAARGFQVTAVDVSSVGIGRGRARAKERALSVDWQEADLERLDLGDQAYDLVVNIKYLQRSLVPRIKRALKNGGHVIFETFLIDQQALGHPSNPVYLLAHNELLGLFRDFRVLHYREGKCFEGAEPSLRASMLAQKIG
jgi:tellurite methyltransferase